MGFDLFYDNLDVIDDEPILVEATIHLIQTEKGGRHSGFMKGFRPNHNFGDPQNIHFFIGQIEMKEGEWMHPGETKDLIVTFLNVQGLKEKLVVGRKWNIQEGSKIIGTGIVKNIITKAL